MTARAPFRFSPINRWVYFPEWGNGNTDRISHDVPFQDGLSGELGISITAKTPLLIGGARRGGTDNAAGAVWPFRLPGGKYGISQSALQGMVRSILEIAAFGKLGPWVDDKRFGIRDLTPGATAIYQRRLNTISGRLPNSPTQPRMKVTPSVKAGWLRQTPKGFELSECDLARIEYNDLAALTGVPAGPLRRRLDPAFSPYPAGDGAFDAAYASDRTAILATAVDWHLKTQARDRYDWVASARRVPIGLGVSLHVEPARSWKQHGRRQMGAGPHFKTLDISYKIARVGPFAGATPKTGRIVLTGNTQDPPRRGINPHKHFEFLFFDDKAPAELRDFGPTFSEFLSIHEPDDGREPNSTWKFFRDTGYSGQLPFKHGGWMPIFYIENARGGIESFGLAFMFKLAHAASTYDLLRNSHPDHLRKDRLDLASLIFGAVADTLDSAPGLKRRAAFDLAVAATANVDEADGPTVLMGPKPSYYPIYVRQPGAKTTDVLPLVGDSQPAATYTPLTPALFSQNFNQLHREHRTPELAGVKIWPARADANVRFPNVPPPPAGAANNRKVQTTLSALRRGATFKTTLRFHNLLPVELGAILWALSFGEAGALAGQDSGLHHRIGMGKPFGLGAVSISIEPAKSSIICNNGTAPLGLGEIMAKFTDHMKTIYKDHGDPGEWKESIQIKSVLATADPNTSNGIELEYMPLGEGAHPPDNTYRGLKNASGFLKWYTDGGEIPLPDEHQPNGAAGASPPAPAAAKNPPAATIALNPQIGARIRLTLGTRSEGVIKEGPFRAAREIEWLILLDGDNKARRYKESLFIVIASSDAAPRLE